MDQNLIIQLILAFITLFFLINNIRYRVYAKTKLIENRQKLNQELSKTRELEVKYLSELHYLRALEENQQTDEQGHILATKGLLEKIKKTIESKEQEMELRFKAEKEIALAAIELKNFKQKIQEFNDLQQQTLNDAKDQIKRIGQDIFNQFKDYHGEKNQLNLEKLQQININLIKILSFEHSIESKITTKDTCSKTYQPCRYSSDFLEKILKLINLKPNEDYFMHHVLSKQDQQKIPAECVITLQYKTLILIDAKFSRILNDNPNFEDNAILQNKLEKYLEYLTTKKYYSNAADFLILREKLSPNYNLKTIIFLPAKEQLTRLITIDEDIKAKIKEKDLILSYPDDITDHIN